MFERAVAVGDQGLAFGRHVQPMVRIVLGKRPVHDLQAFVDCLRVGDEAGNSGTGGGLEEGLGFVLEFDFTRVDAGLRRVEGEAGAHSIGAAAEGVEDGGHFGVFGYGLYEVGGCKAQVGWLPPYGVLGLVSAVRAFRLLSFGVGLEVSETHCLFDVYVR